MLSKYDHAKYPAKCLRDALLKYMKEHNMTPTELCKVIGWKPQYYSRLSRIDWVLTSKAVIKVENALHIQLPDPEDYDENKKIENNVKKLVQIYPPEVIKFMFTDEGYKVFMSAYSNWSDDEKFKKEQHLYKQGLEKLHEIKESENLS